MKTYSEHFVNFKKNFMMYVAQTILFQSCLGSVAAMAIMTNGDGTFQIMQLSLCVIVTMLYNSSLMANMALKHVFKLLILSIVVNTLLLAFNILFYL